MCVILAVRAAALDVTLGRFFGDCKDAATARDTPPSERCGAIQDVLNRELLANWLTGKDVDTALADAEADVQNLLDR